jgi:hypothetical protein
MPGRIGFLFLLLSCAAQWPYAQTASSADIESPSYLLRLERVREKEGLCVMLRGDGQYHVERDTGSRTTVVEGTLDARILTDIFHIASGDQLLVLKQSQISIKTLRSAQDRVILEIHRPGYWQLLLFPDPSARLPYQESMDPLLTWADTLSTLKSSQVVEETLGNNCDPVDVPRLKQRNEEPMYAVRMLDDRFEGGRVVEHTCVIIYTSGTYHLVKQSRKFNGAEVGSAVLDGPVSHADFTFLENILGSIEFQNALSGQLPKPMTFLLTEQMQFAEFFIPQKGSLQRAWKFWKTNRSIADSTEDSSLIYSLRQRVMMIARTDQAVPSMYPRNPRCVPER